MRILKFRAWSTINKSAPKMCYLDPSAPKDGYGRPTGTLFDLKEEDNWKVMQFTGLTDRDGKEIYEGDVVAIPYTDPAGSVMLDSENRGEIQFNHGSFGVVVTGCPVPVDIRAFCQTERTEYVSNYGVFVLPKQATELRVMGNIYEGAP